MTDFFVSKLLTDEAVKLSPDKQSASGLNSGEEKDPTASGSSSSPSKTVDSSDSATNSDSETDTIDSSLRPTLLAAGVTFNMDQTFGDGNCLLLCLA